MAATTTTITGAIVTPSGVGISGGKIEISLSAHGTTDDGGSEQVVLRSLTVPIALDGTVNFDLIPNDAITPGGSFYRFKFVSPSGRSWITDYQPASIAGYAIGDLPLYVEPAVPAAQQLVVAEEADLPTASAAYRRTMAYVEAATGQQDEIFFCMKNASEGYSWVSIAVGV